MYHHLGLITIFTFIISHAVSQPKFQTQVVDTNISIGYGLALGDVDGDGKKDILLADKKQFVWYRNGDWKKFVMIDNLTAHDNVCIAARDLTGDGKVEVAVGAQWNPSETTNADQSGSVHYLVRPADPTRPWTAIKLHHEPTIHRMKWAMTADGKYYLVVVPLHGRGNKNGEGEPVKILAYEFPNNVNAEWPIYPLENNMHLTHNFELSESSEEGKTGLYLGGKEGVTFIREEGNAERVQGLDRGTGEIRIGKLSGSKKFIATIEPMHGNEIVVYLTEDGSKRILLDNNVKEGHALAAADFLGTGADQVIAGWRVPNKDGKTGIKIYSLKNNTGTDWESQWIDENGIACEDIQVADLNGDGKPDIVASGRSTHNLKIYWNKGGK